ncbi:MAG: response regulator [Myxococcota bacterium]|nr:response regulator [Myxococcota bacterium]
MTERPAAYDAVALQRETTFRCSDAPMCVADSSMRILATNPAFDARIGPCRDRSIASFFADAAERERAVEQLATLLASGSSAILRGACATSGRTRVLRWSCRLVGQAILAVVETLTDQVAAEDERGRKPEESNAVFQALPRLHPLEARPRAFCKPDGSVAHDFNNLLTVILGQLQFLRRSPTLTVADGAYVNEAFEATERAVGLTRQLIASARDQEVASRAIRVDSVPSPAHVGGGERILVVEDDEALRLLVVEILHRAGYRVFAAANGDEAMRTLAGGSIGPDLLLTDLVMPHMNGRTLAARIATLCPRARIVLMSGRDDDQPNGRVKGGERSIAILEKPFAEEVLLRKIRDALDAG